MLLNRIEGRLQFLRSRNGKHLHSRQLWRCEDRADAPVPVKADNDSEDNEWTDTGVTRTMENFSAEISVDDISASMPKYNDHGRELGIQMDRNSGVSGRGFC